MDIGRSIGFVFEDKDWVTKVLIGGIVSAIPIVNLVVLGYALRTLRNVGAGKAQPLPEWDDFGGDFVQGLMVCVAGLIYAIPFIAVLMMALVLNGVGDSRAVGASAEGFIRACVFGLSCVLFFLALAVSVWTPAATVNYVASGEFAAFFGFGDIWGLISRNLGDYVVALLVASVVEILAAVVGVVLCGVGLLFTSFVATVVYAHLLGQVLARGRLPAAAAAA